MPETSRPPLQMEVDGEQVEVPDDGADLLVVLRERLGLRAPKDGCSPQGQCGCCTVLVDGQARVACVTPARRVRGRSVTTLDGLDADRRQAWGEAFCATGASQCGFCTPGIVMRLEALRTRGADLTDPAPVEQALLAHLCRCTGWRTILDAAARAGSPDASGDADTSDDRGDLGGATGVPDARTGDDAPANTARATGGPGPRTGTHDPGGHDGLGAGHPDAPDRQPASRSAVPPPPVRSPASPPDANAPDRDLESASRRATVEGRTPQRVTPEVAMGRGGFAEDRAPADCLVAVPADDGSWAVADTLAGARAAAGKTQGRRTTAELTHPLDLPPGDWPVTLRTTWVEPAYLELDAAWCAPGADPASSLANGGAFGAKRSGDAAAAARELADRHGRPVRVVLSREDTVRRGHKRPPLAAGVRRDGTGVVRVARTPGIAATIHAVAPRLTVDEVDVPGPPTSTGLRAAGWAEATALLAAAGAARPPGDGHARPAGTDGSTTGAVAGVVDARRGDGWARVDLRSPDGAAAAAEVALGASPYVTAWVACGAPLDEMALRSYGVGAAHMALGWVTSEGLAVDAEGAVHDLTIRSFGVLRAVDTPPIDVIVEPETGPPVNGSDAVFAAVAAATWLAQDTPTDWPTGRAPRSR